MANEAGLELPIGLTEQKFMQQLARIESRAIKSAQRMEKDFVRANSKIAKSTGEVGKQLDGVFSRISRGASSGFAGVSRGAAAAVASVIALLASLNKLGAYAQNYRMVENRLRSLGEYSDDAAERLTAAALRSRTDLNSMADGVARVQKATGAGFDETIRRVETLNKLMTMGGSSGSEVSSVMIQLSQALSSGVLQGDELRSLREAAPVELLDAIAKAAGGTRDQLKQMGEEGRLTSAVMTQALDSMAATADAGFSRMAPTVADGWTNINTALTTFIGRADEGLGATAALAESMMQLSEWLASNADLAEEFGISVQAALGTFDEYATKAMEALNKLSEFLNTTLREAIYGPGQAFAETGITAGEVIRGIIDALAVMNGALEGTADAVTEAFLKIPDAITGALQSAINAVIGAVEAMVNAVLGGVRSVAAQVDALTGAVASLTGGEGTNLAGGIGNVTLQRSTGVATNYSTRSVSEAYNSGYSRGSGTVNAMADAAGGFLDGITENFERRRDELRAKAEADGLTPGDVTAPPPPGVSPEDDGKGGKGAGGGKGRKEKTTADILGLGEDDARDLERKIQLVGLTTKEAAKLQAQWAMLDEAKKAGVPINDELNAKIQQQAAQVGELTEQLERAEIGQQRFEEAVDGIADAFAGALIAGESLRDGLAQVFKQIASDLMRSGIHDMLSGLIPGGGGKRSGGLLSWLGFAQGGYTGAGGKLEPAGVVHRGEYVMDADTVRRAGGPAAFDALRAGLKGYAAGGYVTAPVMPSLPSIPAMGRAAASSPQAVNINVNVEGANGDQHVISLVQQGVSMGLRQYDRGLPDRIGQINSKPRWR